MPIGTDDTAPYRVFHDISSIPDGTEVSYKAVVLDTPETVVSARRAPP
jgi:alpha-amylase